MLFRNGSIAIVLHGLDLIDFNVVVGTLQVFKQYKIANILCFLIVYASISFIIYVVHFFLDPKSNHKIIIYN